MKPFPLLLPALVFAILAPTAFAGTIANNGAPDQWLGSFSDYDQGQQSGDNFTLGTSATATQIQWWGFYLSGNTPPAQDNFTIGFFKITAGVPSSVPLFSYLVGNAVGRADSGLNTTAFGSDLDIFSYNALIPSSSFLPGSYLLSIVNNTAADTDDEWAWASSESSGTGMEWYRNADADPWIDSSRYEFAFNITGTVPERGSSVVLLALGLISILPLRRRLALRVPR